MLLALENYTRDTMSYAEYAYGVDLLRLEECRIQLEERQQATS